MTPDIISFDNEQAWHALRAQDITSTDVAALFDLSPYKTAFEVWHAKHSGQAIAIQPTERMRWGNRLESAIAHGVAEDLGWSVEPLKVYMRLAALRMGSSFDFQIQHPERGPGIMEIKNVDAWEYRRSWRDDGAGHIEAPSHIELQVQHQMEVSGYAYCAIVAMVGGNTAKVAYRRRDPEIGAAIRAKVAAFWKSIDDGTPPKPDYTRDADLIMQLNANVEQGLVFDARDDAEITALLEEYRQATQICAEQEKRAAAKKAQLLERVGTAEKVLGPWGSLNLARTKDTPPTVITADMVGTSFGGRKGYRQFKATWTKESSNV